MKFISHLLAIACLCSLCGFSARGNGLVFRSNDHLIAERTSYGVFDRTKTIRGDSAYISFDISLLTPHFFGHILNVAGQSGAHYSMVLVTFREKDRIFIDLNINNSSDKISIPIPKSRIARNRWFSVTLCWNDLNETISLTLDKERHTIPHRFAPGTEKLEFTFGLYGKYIDVPSMALRNVEVFDGARQYVFPLDEVEGEAVHEASGRRMGHVSNPEWTSHAHLHWKQRFAFPSAEICGITYDNQANKVIFYRRDTTLVFDINTGMATCAANKGENLFKINSGGAFFLPVRDTSILYNVRLMPGDNCNFALWGYNSGRFTTRRFAPAPNKLHHHNLFTDCSNENIYLFGGYGNYQYSGMVYIFDLQAGEIRDAGFSGERIPPRFFAASGNDFSTGRDLVYIVAPYEYTLSRPLR